MIPAPTKSHTKWVRDNLYKKEGYVCKGEIFCTCCGHTFAQGNRTDKATCPKCGNKLELTKTRKRNVQDKHYFTICTTFKGWQVIRNFQVKRYGKRNNAVGQSHIAYNFHEIGQVWINEQADQVVMGVGRAQFCGWWDDTWMHQDLSVKRGNNRDDYLWNATNGLYPQIDLLPKLQYSAHLLDDDMCLPLALRTLMDSHGETILKAGYTELFKVVASSGKKLTNGQWTAIKICIRNRYKMRDRNGWRSYFDYISALVELGKDVHNAHYVCPADFHAAHDKAMKELDKMRRRKQQERQRKEALKQEETYIKHHKKFFGLEIIGNGINITPLKCIDDFFNEGLEMHHCVYQMKYYEKKMSLILSARNYVGGERLETIEIDLRTFKIVQCQGVCNRNTKMHKAIVELMNEHMDEVKKLSRLSA